VTALLDFDKVARNFQMELPALPPARVFDPEKTEEDWWEALLGLHGLPWSQEDFDALVQEARRVGGRRLNNPPLPLTLTRMAPHGIGARELLQRLIGGGVQLPNPAGLWAALPLPEAPDTANFI